MPPKFAIKLPVTICLLLRWLQPPLLAPCTQACAASMRAADSSAHSSGLCGNPHKCSCAPTPTAPLWGR
jgi:hypothetical protein